MKVAWLLLGDATSPGQAFERWVALVRKRCRQLRDSGFPHRAPKNVAIPFDLSPSSSLERERYANALKGKNLSFFFPFLLTISV